MKKLITIVLSLFVAFTINADVILTQGKINVTTEEFDGYAYRIPDEDRRGYFDSPKRIESALFSILNMKHIIEYGSNKNMIDYIQLEIDVDNHMQKRYPNSLAEFDVVKENRLKLIRDFIKIEESFKQVQDEIRKMVDKNDLIELAEEKYIVNKSQYIQEETRDIDFISVLYNKNNKEEQRKVAEQLLQDIKSDIKSFKETSDMLSDKQANIEIYRFDMFKYDKKHPEFSYKLFTIENTGFFPEIITFNNRFILVNIAHIETAKQLTFDDKKDEIIASLHEKNVEIKYNNIILSLTQDKIEFESSNVISLRTRY